MPLAAISRVKLRQARMPDSRWLVATRVPTPALRWSSPSNTSLLMPERTVPRLTPNCAAGVGNNTTDDTGQTTINSGVTAITKQSGILNSSLRLIWVEEDDWRGDNYGAWVFGYTTPSWGDRIADFHGGGSSFGFADGHSENHHWLLGNTVAWSKDRTVTYAWPANPSGAANVDLMWIKQRFPCL